MCSTMIGIRDLGVGSEVLVWQTERGRRQVRLGARMSKNRRVGARALILLEGRPFKVLGPLWGGRRENSWR